MLTNRQREILNLIVNLYGRFEQPVGSNTVLKEGLLKVSPATIRNDMVVLEKHGFVTKAHTSSGRYPSIAGIRYYVDHLTQADQEFETKPHEAEVIKDFFQSPWQTPEQKGQMAADLIASLIDYPVIVYGQSGEPPKLQEVALTYVDAKHLIVTLLTQDGDVESQLLPLNFEITSEQVAKVSRLLQDELTGLPLNQVFQRMRLTLPLLVQQAINYQIDFGPLIDKTRHHLKGYYYVVTNKFNLFDFIDSGAMIKSVKDLLKLLEGSPEMLHLLDQRQEGIELISNKELLPDHEVDVHLITATYNLHGKRQTLGLLGPSTMPFQRIVRLLVKMMDELTHM